MDIILWYLVKLMNDYIFILNDKFNFVVFGKFKKIFGYIKSENEN